MATISQCALDAKLIFGYKRMQEASCLKRFVKRFVTDSVLTCLPHTLVFGPLYFKDEQIAKQKKKGGGGGMDICCKPLS